LKDVYAGNGEFSREKQHVVNESTVDIAEVYKFNKFQFLLMTYYFINFICF